MQRSRGAQPGNRNALKHGIYASRPSAINTADYILEISTMRHLIREISHYHSTTGYTDIATLNNSLRSIAVATAVILRIDLAAASGDPFQEKPSPSTANPADWLARAVLAPCDPAEKAAPASPPARQASSRRSAFVPPSFSRNEYPRRYARRKKDPYASPGLPSTVPGGQDRPPPRQSR